MRRFPRRQTGRSGIASILVVLAACTLIPLITVEGIGEFGRPISIASQSEDPLPRLAVGLYAETCPGPAGGCESFCEGPPAACAVDDCMPAVIASGTPFTVFPRESGYSLDRECIEVRAAKGLDGAPSAEDLEAAVSRFRFDDLPVVRVPEDDAAGWAWQIGDDLRERNVGAVIGGNLLKYFAIEFRHQLGADPSVAFFGVYPGTEEDLANQGRGFIRLQFPGRLVGRLLDDRCTLGDGSSENVDCELDELDLRPDIEVLVYESTRMVVDACLGWSPCGLDWDLEDGCRLTTQLGTDTDCLPPTESGRGGSFLVATEVPGLVLIDSSAELMFGPADSLPDCGAVGPEDGVCREGAIGHLHLPGYPPLEDLMRLRVRSLALVTGLDETSGGSPCSRLERRLEGGRRQCRDFAEELQPWRPADNSKASFASSVAAYGETVLAADATAPDTSRWIETLLVPDTSPTIIAIRRDVGSEPVELDGLVGSFILRSTETVLDYTEADEKPGVRIACLDSEECTVFPACSPDPDTNSDDGGVGRLGCCYGLPQALVTEAVLRGIDKEAPRVEDSCCPALDADIRAELDDLGLCTDTYRR